MNKVREDYIDTSSDKESYKWLKAFVEKYPTEKGYRIESFISENFIRITVYQLERK